MDATFLISKTSIGIFKSKFFFLLFKVSGAYAVALENAFTPTFLALSRQNLPNLEGSTPDKVFLGAYTLFGMYVSSYLFMHVRSKEKKISSHIALSPSLFK